jgi:hypothetical protein
LSTWKMMALTVSMGGSQVGHHVYSFIIADYTDSLDSVSPEDPQEFAHETDR